MTFLVCPVSCSMCLKVLLGSKLIFLNRKFQLKMHTSILSRHKAMKRSTILSQSRQRAKSSSGTDCGSLFSYQCFLPCLWSSSSLGDEITNGDVMGTLLCSNFCTCGSCLGDKRGLSNRRSECQCGGPSLANMPLYSPSTQYQ